MNADKTVALIILDGWGLTSPGPGNAVEAAHTPTFDRIWNECPHTTLDASGEAVGLPDGQMGNSEVGHTNLGAGRVVYQSSTLISKQIREGEFFENEVLLDAMKKAKGKRLHLMGLVSDGGVHSQLTHLVALLEMAKDQELDTVFVHTFLDGRDTIPTGGADYLATIQQKLDELSFSNGKIATIIGRYWVMDRDKRWERTELSYRALRQGAGDAWSDSAEAAIRNQYEQDVTDEFIKPIILDANGTVQDDDVVIFFNFRPDRARQISHAFTDENFDGFDRGPKPKLHYVGMTKYESNLNIKVAYPPQGQLKNVLGEVIANKGLKQFRLAETEKYAHVTYFFNNGREEPFDGEAQQLIPSPKVPTYDLQPEMNSTEVTQAAVDQINSGEYAFVLINFANPDMVGHTGVIDAAIKAVEATDVGLEKILEDIESINGEALIVADHGNAEMMLQPDGSPHTAHTTNPVPMIYVGSQPLTLEEGGKLGDVAPTVLHLLGIHQPEEMTGRCLIQH